MLLRSAEIQPLFIDLPLSSLHTTHTLSQLHYQTNQLRLPNNTGSSGQPFPILAQCGTAKCDIVSWFPQFRTNKLRSARAPQCQSAERATKCHRVSWFRKPTLPIIIYYIVPSAISSGSHSQSTAVSWFHKPSWYIIYSKEQPRNS